MTKEQLLTRFGVANKLEFGFDGWVYLVDVMGNDEDICDAARCSYGKGTRVSRDNEALIRYLVANWHTSPVEQARIKVHMRLPIYVKNQLQRHRTAHFTSANEYSQRYSIAPDVMEQTDPTQWRLQSSSNKQGSNGLLTEWPSDDVLQDRVEELDLDPHDEFRIRDCFTKAKESELTPGEYLSAQEAALQYDAYITYLERLVLGNAREQARKDLPLSIYTEMYWTIDLSNLLWLLQLRLDPHAQKEIRELAEAIAAIIKVWTPSVWEAFEDYRTNSMTLSAGEISVLKDLLGSTNFVDALTNLLNDKDRASYLEGHGLQSKTERIAFVQKLKTLGG